MQSTHQMQASSQLAGMLCNVMKAFVLALLYLCLNGLHKAANKPANARYICHKKATLPKAN